MQIWLWSCRTGENIAYGDTYAMSSAILSDEAGGRRAFASREDAEAHFRLWLREEMGECFGADCLSPITAEEAEAVIDKALLGEKATFDGGFRFVSGVEFYTLSV